VRTPPRTSSLTVCRLARTSPIGTPPASRVTPMARRTGFGQPGSSTGGVMRDASGTASVSAAVPSPARGPGSSRPGM
jgi:hypothetical protein